MNNNEIEEDNEIQDWMDSDEGILNEMVYDASRDYELLSTDEEKDEFKSELIDRLIYQFPNLSPKIIEDEVNGYLM